MQCHHSQENQALQCGMGWSRCRALKKRKSQLGILRHVGLTARRSRSDTELESLWLKVWWIWQSLSWLVAKSTRIRQTFRLCSKLWSEVVPSSFVLSSLREKRNNSQSEFDMIFKLSNLHDRGRGRQCKVISHQYAFRRFKDMHLLRKWAHVTYNTHDGIHWIHSDGAVWIIIIVIISLASTKLPQ